MGTPEHNGIGLVREGFSTLHYILNGGSDVLFWRFVWG